MGWRSVNHEQQDPREREPLVTDGFVLDVMSRAPTPDAAHQIDQIYSRYGRAYAVYLSLEDVDPYAEASEANFKDAYVGFYWTRDDLIDDAISAFGWERDLDRLLHGAPELREFVTFDRDQVWGFVADHYRIEPLGGGHYVFERPPGEP